VPGPGRAEARADRVSCSRSVQSTPSASGRFHAVGCRPDLGAAGTGRLNEIGRHSDETNSRLTSPYCRSNIVGSLLMEMNPCTDAVREDVAVSSAKRRGTGRYPLREHMKYSLLNRRSVTEGTGETVNMGSGGVLFTTQHRLLEGQTVALSINWPARLDGTCLLKFVATGRVVRSGENWAAARIDKYDFHTRAAIEPRPRIQTPEGRGFVDAVRVLARSGGFQAGSLGQGNAQLAPASAR
jgi:hypothetical protein